MIVYPKNDLDKIEKMVSILGGYWSESYEGRDQIRDIVSSRSKLWQQALISWEEAVKSRSRKDITSYSTSIWVRVVLDKSKGASVLNDYKGKSKYGNTPYIKYGEISGASWDLPIGVVGVSQIYNRVSEPSASLFETIDYNIDRRSNRIVFKINPFNNAKFPRELITNNDGTVDEQLTMWFHMAKIDKKAVQRFYGVPIGIDGESGDSYKDLVNQVYDCLIEGPSSYKISKVIGDSIECPISKNTETVIDISEGSRTIIVTDKEVYYAPEGAESTVTLGQTIAPGISLSDALSIKEIRRGVNLDNLPSLTIGAGLVDNSILGNLSFVNDNVPVDTVKVGSRVNVTFKIGGHPFDVDQFWKLVRKNEDKKKISLAHILSKTPAGKEVDEVTLPRQINPLRFLVDELMPRGVNLITIKAGRLLKSIPRLDAVLEVCPLNSFLFFIFETPLVIDDSLEVVSESEVGYTAANTISSDQSISNLDSKVTIKSISSQCF